MREESIQDRLQRRISETLMKAGLSNCLVTVVPGKVPERPDADAWHDAVAGLVMEHHSKANPKFDLDADDEHPSPFGELPFSSLGIHKGILREKWSAWVIVNFFVVKDVLEVERTIQDTINKKVAKRYSDASALWLLLQPGDGAHTIEQVELRAAKIQNLDRFAQVWWVYPQRGADTEIFRFQPQSEPLTS